jgi:hypothetical protein
VGGQAGTMTWMGDEGELSCDALLSFQKNVTQLAKYGRCAPTDVIFVFFFLLLSTRGRRMFILAQQFICGKRLR